MTKAENIKIRLLENRLTVAWLHFRLKCLGHELSIDELNLILSLTNVYPNQAIILLDCDYILNLYDDFFGKHPMLNEKC